MKRYRRITRQGTDASSTAQCCSVAEPALPWTLLEPRELGVFGHAKYCLLVSIITSTLALEAQFQHDERYDSSSRKKFLVGLDCTLQNLHKVQKFCFSGWGCGPI
ncbi:Uncharacterized protein HZ326_5038 [Fusarium oxysporum f. sp. albedinis]|nr:Uncharacterized protein HZ326_5038 [Fusarium oxysporum f. sp. albedinis]